MELIPDIKTVQDVYKYCTKQGAMSYNDYKIIAKEIVQGEQYEEFLIYLDELFDLES